MSRKGKWVKRIVSAVAVAAAVAAVAASVRPKPLPVETAEAVRGALTVSVDGAGRTRMPDRQTISAPVSGDLGRIALRPGDAVAAGQVVAEIRPSASQPLDARSRAEAAARLGGARAGLAEARRNVERAEVAAELAAKETARMRTLVEGQSAPARSLELAVADQRSREAELAMAKLSVEQARREADAIAALLGQKDAGAGQSVEISAPAGGVVLRVHVESAGPVTVGTPLLEIGGGEPLELVVELPTQSAVRVRPGARVRIDGVGNRAELAGAVRRVEPSGFTKVTALGVEEQRVKAIVDPAGDTAAWGSLGDGFAADAHIVVNEAQSVLKVPSGAVFRSAGGYAVFRVAGGRADLTPVDIGERSADEVEIRNGLAEGAAVVVHPSDKLANGSLIKAE